MSTVEWISRGVVAFIRMSTVYYFWVNSVYLILLVAAIFSLKRYLRVRPIYKDMIRNSSGIFPAVSLIAPAYNEEATILQSVKSFLMLDYPKFEVLVVNDGSKDRMLELLKEAFLLEPISYPYDDRLSRTQILGIYQSRLHPNLRVIDKVNGGKADALNVGIGFAQNELFCAVDSDSLLENDALLKVVIPFVERPTEMMASGGTIRIVNGSKVEAGRVKENGLPSRFLPLMQVIEYTRAFLCGRIGWDILNCTLVISGAFGLFRKEAVIQVGGYREGSMGEDMELIVRIHRHFLKRKQPYAVSFVPDPVCWTEAPESFSVLSRQRNRWQRGLCETLFPNRDMIFNFRFGAIGFIALPYFFFVELLGAIIEVIAYVALIAGYFLGVLESSILVPFLAAGLLYGLLMSVAALLLEEVYFPKYTRVRQFLALLGACLVEPFFYRQLNLFWRLKGLYSYLAGNRSWGNMSRTGFTQG